MARGGARPGAGRKQGSASAKTREIANKAAEEGITPLEVLINSMREAWEQAKTQKNPDDKLARMGIACGFAKDAAPYLHPKLANVEIQPLDENGDFSDGFTLNVNLVKRES